MSIPFIEGQTERKGFRVNARMADKQHALSNVELDPRFRITPLSEEEFKRVEEMSTLHCSDWELAYTLGMTVKAWHKYLVFNPDLQTKLNAARARGARGLRAVQMRAALEGNTSMMIWLGRCILGQNKDQSIGSSTPEALQEISEEAKQHLVELTSVIYNNPQLRQSNPVDIDAQIVESDGQSTVE